MKHLILLPFGHSAGRVDGLLSADSDIRMALVQQSCLGDSNGPCTIEKRAGGKPVGNMKQWRIERLLLMTSGNLYKARKMASSLWHSHASRECVFWHVLKSPTDMRQYRFAFPLENRLPFHTSQKRSPKAEESAKGIKDMDSISFGKKWAHPRRSALVSLSTCKRRLLALGGSLKRWGRKAQPEITTLEGKDKLPPRVLFCHLTTRASGILQCNIDSVFGFLGPFTWPACLQKYGIHPDA